MGHDNIWTDTWDEGEEWSGGAAHAKGSQTGDQLWVIHDVEPPHSYAEACGLTSSRSANPR